MAATPEAKVKAKIKELFKKYGAVYAMPVGTGYGASGVSDFLVCCRGVFIAVEAKAGTNKPTELQLAFLREIDAAGGVALVINEKNLNVLEHTLELISRMEPVPISLGDYNA